jgi:hypothetical protein
MCPACILTIGGGLLIARRLGVEDIVTIGLATIILSILIDFIARKINKGKPFFSYQRIIIPILLLIILSLTVKFFL